MKLRIKGNSIRLRLLRSEIERFAANSKISEEIRFGPEVSAALKYSLVISSSAKSLKSRFEHHEIIVEVPENDALDWIESEKVGLEATQLIGETNLLILIEKDFACLDRPDDPDRKDAFPNPAADCKKGGDL
jgi:hypothetical protein